MVERVRVNGAQNSPASVTAHELHNLISVIIAEAQLLQLDFPTDAPHYRSAIAIERAGRRLEALIDRLTTSLDTAHTWKMSRETPSFLSTDSDRQDGITTEEITERAEA